MNPYYIYSLATGKLLFIGTTIGAEQYCDTNTQGIVYGVEVGSPESQYHNLSTGVLTDKPALVYTIDTTTIDADGVDAVTISGLPNPTKVTWPDGQVDNVVDGEVIFTVDLAGTYYIKLEAYPALPQIVVITAL